MTTIALKNRMTVPFQPSLFAFTAPRESTRVFSMGNACCARLSTIHPTAKEAKTHSSYTTKNSSRLRCVFRLRSKTYMQISFEEKNFSHAKEL
jgi:hypothetical protein